MVKSAFIAAATAGVFLASPVTASLYLSSSPVIQVDGKNYDSLIAKSNYTSIVEFYAPWCGHCKNLKPAYEKAAKNLAGLAKVAAVNCDDDANKAFCGQFGVQGFPTLKIIRPSKKPGKPTVEDFQGGRTAKAIVDAVIDKIPNHVKRLTDKQVDEFLKTDVEQPKAILFTEKGTTSALLRAVAIDFLGSISVAQVRNSQKETVETFGITSFPTLILLPGGDKEKLVYDGDMKKDAIIKFLSQVATPNPDPAPSDAKKSSKQAKSSKEPKKASKAKEEPAPSEKPAQESSSKDETDSQAADDVPPPVIVTEPPPSLRILEHAPALEEACLQPKSHTCVLVLLPEKPLDNPDAPLIEEAEGILSAFAQIHDNHEKRKIHLFPFYNVPNMNSAGLKLRQLLDLNDVHKTEIVAVNAKRNWWRHYGGAELTQNALEDWIDGIRMGDIKKQKLPAGIIPEEPVVEEEPIQVEVEDAPEKVDDKVEETTEEKPHDEL